MFECFYYRYSNSDAIKRSFGDYYSVRKWADAMVEKCKGRARIYRNGKFLENVFLEDGIAMCDGEADCDECDGD